MDVLPGGTSITRPHPTHFRYGIDGETLDESNKSDMTELQREQSGNGSHDNSLPVSI
jgi:hypothetical protein